MGIYRPTRWVSGPEVLERSTAMLRSSSASACAMLFFFSLCVGHPSMWHLVTILQGDKEYHLYSTCRRMV